MSLLGFLFNGTKAIVKIAISPIVAIDDIIEGEPFEKTGIVLESAIEDVEDSGDELLDLFGL